MQIYDNRAFERIYDHASGDTFSGMEFTKCRFLSCAASITEKPELRSTFRNMRFIGCEVRACTAYSAILEDLLVDGLKTVTQFKTWGAVFKHVTLKGRIGNVKISDFIPPGAGSQSYWDRVNMKFQAANAEYYKNVDWALDISQAEFEECEIKGVPGRLIRRDPETQVLVSRCKVLELESEWRKLDLSKTHWATSLQSLIKKEHHADRVLVAPKRSKNFKELLEGLNLLRRAGVAEPD